MNMSGVQFMTCLDTLEPQNIPVRFRVTVSRSVGCRRASTSSYQR